MKFVFAVLLTLSVVTPALAGNSQALSNAVKLAGERVKGNICQAEAFEPAIISELAEFSTDAKVLKATLPKFPVIEQALHQNFTYKRLFTGYFVNKMNLSALRLLIIGTHFENHLGFVNGAGEAFTFTSDTEVNVARTAGDGSMKEEAGTYEVEEKHDELFVTVEVSGVSRTFSITATGKEPEDLLVQVGSQGEPQVFSSAPWECEN